MTDTCLLEYSIRSSNEGDLVIRLCERNGGATYFVHCRKSASVFDLAEHPCSDNHEGAAVWSRDLSADEATQLLRLMNAISVPLLPSYMIGLDGVSHELCIERGFCKVTLTWWNEMPQQWKSLEALLNHLLRLANIPTPMEHD